MAVPFEKRCAQVLLQGADLTAQDRLSDVQSLRRAAEVEQLGDRHEVADLPQVEVHGRPFRRRGGDAFRVSPPAKEVLDGGQVRRTRKGGSIAPTTGTAGRRPMPGT